MSIASRGAVLHAAIGLSAILAVCGHHLTAADRWLVYFCKPLTTGLILLLAATAPARPPHGYKWSIVSGLAFSLAGDVFLMLPGDYFLAGLASFLPANLCYLVAFTRDSAFAAKPLPFVLWTAAGAGAVAFLWRGVPAELRLPVLVYIAAILAMASQAASRHLSRRAPGSAAACLGATLFVISDTLLAVHRFRPPSIASPALVLPAYYAAQWLIALSTRPARPRVREGAPPHG